jgi:hypothetical protein
MQHARQLLKFSGKSVLRTCACRIDRADTRPSLSGGKVDAQQLESLPAEITTAGAVAKDKGSTCVGRIWVWRAGQTPYYYTGDTRRSLLPT